MKHEGWEIAYIASGMGNASIITGRLEAEGIPTRLEYEAAGRIYAITIDGLGEIRILVPSEYIEKAREILSIAYNEEEIPWNEK